MSSNAYKELNRKFISLKREQAEEREKVMNVSVGLPAEHQIEDRQDPESP